MLIMMMAVSMGDIFVVVMFHHMPAFSRRDVRAANPSGQRLQRAILRDEAVRRDKKERDESSLASRCHVRPVTDFITSCMLPHYHSTGCNLTSSTAQSGLD